MRTRAILILLGLAMVVGGCSEEEPTKVVTSDAQGTSAPAADHEALAWALLERAGWPVDESVVGVHPEMLGHGGHDPIITFERRIIVGSIAHYSAQVQVGPGQFDVIGIHRVVREEEPCHPIRAKRSVVLHHGSGKDFSQNFLPGATYEHVPDDYGMATYLAQSDIDVWGIDQSSTLLPWMGEEASFLGDWGLQRHVDDLDTAVGIARAVRLMSGNGNRRMVLSGFSTGVFIGYALLNQEAGLPPGKRNIGGFIPVDYDYLLDDPDLQQQCCEDADWYEEEMQAGVYAGYSFMLLFGQPAESDPDGPSELIPGLTNLEAALSVFSLPTGPPHPGHFFAGLFNSSDVATGLRYVDTPAFLDFCVVSPPYQTLYAFERDQCRVICPTIHTPWETNLADIRVPIFCVSAAGGYGSPDDLTLGIVASRDITTLVVSGPEQLDPKFDYGHVDLFAAYNAPELFWQPVLEWIIDHTH